MMGVMLNSRNEGLENVSHEKWNYPVDSAFRTAAGALDADPTLAVGGAG